MAKLIIILVILILIWMFNQIIKENNLVKKSFSTVDVYLKKRYDLVPNLVEIVKGHAAHEKEVFENIANARSKAMESKTEEESVKSDNELNKALKSLFMVAEQYPNLKTNQSFVELQKKLTNLEDELAAARRAYNAAVTEYNTTLESFPTNLMGKLMRKKQKELFVVNDDIRNAINMKF